MDFRMKGDPLPDSNYIARYCKPTQAPNGQIQATAFMLRSGGESLSVNWLEYLNCSSREHEISEIRNIYPSTFRRVGANAKIAVLNVGEVRGKVLKESEDRINCQWESKSVPIMGKQKCTTPREKTCAYEGVTVISSPPC